MSSPIDRRRLLLSAAALGVAPTSGFAQAREELFEVSHHETATIDGRRWDTTRPGGTTVDAVHRSVLLRFPGAADDIAALLRQGRVLVRAALWLRYSGYELVPEGYLVRDGLGRKLWTENPPTWHVVAWPLLQPWMSHEKDGPTFNASVNGRRYWKRFGASDPNHDRRPDLIDPQELSRSSTEARFDVTKLLATPVLERDAGARLRWLEQCGFLLRKLETYDSRYREPGNAYEWAMPIGGHGLRFTAPRLVVALRRVAGGSVSVVLPNPMERDWQLRTSDGSQPTALLPKPAELVERMSTILQVTGPREAWEQTRIDELRKVGGDTVSRWTQVEGLQGYKDYQERLKTLLAMPPRYWIGWDIEDELLVWYLFRDLLPAPAQEHMKKYWEAWLQPDLPTDAFLHPQSRDAIDYWVRNRDWRGRASFFRNGYNFAVSTMNFNHTAAMGALLGGAMIGAENAMADGHHGLEALLLRFWGFLDGSSQEMLDHYYLSITLSAQKMFADFAPQPIQRLMGRILVDRTMEMLITLYHSQTRRFVSSSTRTRITGVLIEQDGVYSALHTVSKDGAVKYLDLPADGRVHGMPVWGYDFPPGRAAVQSLRQPWAPSWVAALIDNKPVPFEETAAESTRNNFKPPLWRRSYLGRWHGLATSDIRGGTVDVMAQWVRTPQKSSRLEDLGTLSMRYCANTPDLATTSDGSVPQPGLTLAFQSRNRAIVFAKPHNNRSRLAEGLPKEGVSRLATVIGLWNFNAKPDWQIDAKDRRRILIRDGVTYLAILALPAADLGRDLEIEIGRGGGGKTPPTNVEVAPALIISQFNMKRDKPAALSEAELRNVMTRTYGGFVIEMGDVEQYGSFDAFAKHIAAAELTAAWRENDRRLDVSYRSGGDLMEAGFTTDFSQPSEHHFAVNPGQQEKAIPYRRLNGKWPYLPAGIERDTTWAQQGTTGRLEKNGAVLLTEPGRKAYLLADPLSGAVVGYNPLPDAQTWALSTRDGVSIKADGKVPLLRVEYRPWSKELDISHTPAASQNGADMARTMTVTGLVGPPRVTLNGRAIEPVRSDASFRIVL